MTLSAERKAAIDADQQRINRESIAHNAIEERIDQDAFAAAMRHEAETRERLRMIVSGQR